MIYRITHENKVVGAIVAASKAVALAYAIGKYGAGADVVKVSPKDALSSTGLCVIIETREITLEIAGHNPRKIRSVV